MGKKQTEKQQMEKRVEEKRMEEKHVERSCPEEKTAVQTTGRQRADTVPGRLWKLIQGHPAGAAGLLAGIIAACLVSGTATKESRIQQEIAGQVVRFHVKANSDRIGDQQVKMEVRDALLTGIGELLEGSESREESEGRIREHLDEIRKTAQMTVEDCGSRDRVTVELKESYFPEKSYGAYTLPAGIYEALQVRIGEANGHNWWCMLYPSLCFSDAMHPVLEEEGGEKLRQVLSDEAYDAILKNDRITFGFYWF